MESDWHASGLQAAQVSDDALYILKHDAVIVGNPPRRTVQRILQNINVSCRNDRGQRTHLP